MSVMFKRGASQALEDLGLKKRAAEPEMGSSLYENITSANNEAGRTGIRTLQDPKDQTSAAFNQQTERLNEDVPDSSTEIPVGSGQSKRANYKLQGRRDFRGLKISIENKKGSIRKWYDPHNKQEGKTRMKYPYGYIRLTEGMDGDHVDCFIGLNENAKKVYVITTNKAPDFTKPDEQKCMLGFDSEKEARRAFHQHYNDPRFLRSIKAIPFETFKKKVLSTRNSSRKKVSSNLSKEDLETPIKYGPGPTHNQVPGDFLGLPQSSLVGLRSVAGEGETPRDKIDRQFNFHDQEMNTHTLEGDTGGAPESPAV